MNKEEFLLLLRRHQGIIYKLVALYALDPEDKKDLYQEILLQAWRSFGKFRGDSEFSTWLYKVALFTILTQKRKISPMDYKASMESYAGELTTNPAEISPAVNLRLAIRQLEEADRAIISMHLDGYSNDEIAAMIGISSNHAAVKLHRIKKQLSKHVKQAG